MVTKVTINIYMSVEKHRSKQTGSQQYFECLTFEGQEDPGSREGLVGGGQRPER